MITKRQITSVATYAALASLASLVVSPAIASASTPAAAPNQPIDVVTCAVRTSFRSCGDIGMTSPSAVAEAVARTGQAELTGDEVRKADARHHVKGSLERVSVQSSGVHAASSAFVTI